jgi:hypothetical protein
VGVALPGAEGEEVDTAEGWVRLDGVGEHEAIHIGHVEVEQDQVNGGRGGRRLGQAL